MAMQSVSKLVSFDLSVAFPGGWGEVPCSGLGWGGQSGVGWGWSGGTLS